ncbi:MAG: MoxR family ATPase [Pseudomonadota bacterium]
MSLFNLKSAAATVTGTNTEAAAPFVAALDQLSTVIVGKRSQLSLALTCLLARGHLLIEDLPGVGKTTLAQALARTLGLDQARVQFTSDLLPADILGVSIYRREHGDFEFHAGPVFTQLLLADEINRATPKSQSALLEAMEERQVTVEGNTRELPDPFFVIATQNPARQIGTYDLPESQLDRFLMRLELGYPDAAAERELLLGTDRRYLLKELAPVMSLDELRAAQAQVPKVHVAEALVDYLQDLLAYTRRSAAFEVGLSPRGGIALLRAAQSWAVLAGRNHVIPEDIQSVFGAVVGHRVVPAGDGERSSAGELGEYLLQQVPVP